MASNKQKKTTASHTHTTHTHTTHTHHTHTHTHTHRHYTLLCILLFRFSETKKNIQNSEQIFSLYYRPNKGFHYGDDYANSSILVGKSTVPYVLRMAAEETHCMLMLGT